jgi:hypothetical protein
MAQSTLQAMTKNFVHCGNVGQTKKGNDDVLLRNEPDVDWALTKFAIARGPHVARDEKRT